MVIVDETVVNVALPSVQRDLGLSQAQLTWVVNAYLLFFGGFLMLSGRMADVFGRRRVFLGGLVVFTAASVVAGFADGRLLLIAMRALQGLGGAMLSPAALSILTTTFRAPRERRLALAAWAGLLGLGATVGVLLGGVIVEYLSWHWIFWVNGPVGVVVLVICLSLIPATVPQERGGLDLPGAVLITAAGMLLVFTVVRVDEQGWGSRPTLLGLAGVALLGAGFGLRQRSAAQPLVPRYAVARRSAVAYPLAVLVASALFAMFFFLTLYMQVVQGWSALQTGMAWAPQGATVAVTSGLAVRLMPVLGARTLTTTGLLIAAAAQLLLLRTTLDGSYPAQVLPALVVNAVGLGLALVPLAVVAVHGLADRDQGIASGLLSASQQLGGAVGMAVLVSVALSTFHHEVAGGTAVPAATLQAFHVGYLASTVLLVIAAAAALLLPPLHERVDLGALAG
jgi:EmrB/QacA subfamily drug resistance transporter